MSKIKKTPLANEHERLGGKMVDFAGWWMPVQFNGLQQEHLAVRNSVGIFDVSHMGEIRVTGERSVATLQWLTTNDVTQLKQAEAQYSLLTNFEGGVVDDLIVYCIKPNEDYLLCVNAANIEKDYNWIVENNKGADLLNESDYWAQVAIQGPKAVSLTEKVFDKKLSGIKSFNFTFEEFHGETCMVARTGYTGEDGFEVFLPKNIATDFWSALLKEGEEFSVEPIGLGARDTLRTEMKYSLYGHEITDKTNPLEAGLGWVVKLQAKNFIGKDKILAIKKSGIERKLIGFKMVDRGIARAGYPLISFDNKEIGEVTSGTPSPSSGDNIGIGYLPLEYAEPGKQFLVQVRARKLKAVTVKTPFIQK